MTQKGGSKRSSCPISYALEIFGDRWTLLVLRDLMLEARFHYKDLLASADGIATNVLADRLKRLERRGLIRRERDPSDARQFIYMPTQAAIGLIPMLIELIVWSAENTDSSVDPELIRRFHNDRENLIAELQNTVGQRAGLG